MDESDTDIDTRTDPDTVRTTRTPSGSSGSGTCGGSAAGPEAASSPDGPARSGGSGPDGQGPDGSGPDGSASSASAETTRRVDTAGSARGDARMPRRPVGPSGRNTGPGRGPDAPDDGERPPVTGRFTTPGRPAAATASGSTGAPVADLSSARLLRPSRRPPQTGWRRVLYLATGGLVNPGESAGDSLRRELISRVNQPLTGCYKIAMLSLKGGVGKTTMTTTLGSTFASLRGDRVVAVDANPDRGTLSQKIPLETTATVRHLLRDASLARRYSDVRAYTSQGPSRLEILGSEQDPAVSVAFSETDYRRFSQGQAASQIASVQLIA